MTTKTVALWHGPEGVDIPKRAMDVKSIVPYAAQLTAADQKKIIRAFEFESFDMASEFVWRRTMSKLRSTLSSMGMAFIGEMLGRDDITDSSPIETVLTDYDTIKLAEALGVISATGAMKLRHAFESLAHYSNSPVDGEIDGIEAVSIIKNSIQFVLGDEDTYVPMDFRNIRDRLTAEPISLDDPQLKQLVESPAFYVGTALRILVSAIKNLDDAKLENALNNINVILPGIWNKMSEQDKYLVGTTYAQVAAKGKSSSVSGLKNALLKVNGFDYVPETIRSVTYKQVAKSIIDAHYSYSNYYAEPAPTKRLAELGTTIPKSALPDCIQALLCVSMGNSYGYSIAAKPIADRQLKALSQERWQYYFDKVLHSDDIILGKLLQDKPLVEFRNFIKDAELCEIVPQHPQINRLFSRLCSDASNVNIDGLVRGLLTRLRGE
jgi:hypothetical protein